MKKVALKNRMMFFGGTAIVGVIAIFVFFAIFAAPQAHAYAIGSAPTDITPGVPATNASAGGTYDIGSSFENLISPFTNFISSLKLNSGTTVNTSGETPGFSVTNYTPDVEQNIQSTVSGWLSQFDNWFYGISGVHLSGIFYVLLSAIAWTLGLAQNVVNWLLGLFH